MDIMRFMEEEERDLLFLVQEAYGEVTMDIMDVPPGWLVVAVQEGNAVYCLECRTMGNGEEALTEDDLCEIASKGDVWCAGCGELLAEK